MSLINQMLRDLEQRNSSKPGTNQPEPLNLQTSRYQPQNHHKHGWWLLVLLPAVGVWFWTRQTPSEPAVSVAPPAPIQTAAIIPPQPNPDRPVTPIIKPAITTPPSVEQPAVAVAVVAPAIISTPVAHHQQAAEALTKQSSKPARPPQKTTVSKQTNPILRVDTLYRRAIDSPSLLMRKNNLREVLQIEPRHLAARNLLLQTLLQERSTLELKQFLDDSLALYPDNLVFLTALGHYHVQQKNFSAAIATLEQVDSFRINDPQYLALLAASYQQQQQFAQAFPIYQKLTQQQPEKAENWLGLGVCADRLQQTRTAAAAYRQALQKNNLNSTVVDYINQRLNTLPR